MKKSEKELKMEIKKMMKDSFHQDNLYTAGNYWKFYEKNILKQIEKNTLSRFRSWKGGAAVGNIQSFSGGSEFVRRKFGRNFHPIDEDFNFFDESYLIKKYNSLINRLIKYLPFLKYFLVRVVELKKYYKNIYEASIREKYEIIKKYDEDLLKISDSTFGIDKNELVYVEGKPYTNRFLKELGFIIEMKKEINLKNINYIVELGAGIGLLASVFLKLNKIRKYLIIDIPPTLFFSQYYLQNIGFNVFGYSDVLKERNVDPEKIFKKYDVICMPSWAITKLNNFKFDLFINIYSFQEMEKKQTINYLKILKEKIDKYIFIENSISGHSKAKKINEFGVLEQTKLENVENYLKKDFSTIKKEINTDKQIYKILLKKNK
tara:strand:- start:872 stop:1999 length:1128 start_codon:yes stop_codon:yes gene_type:complete